MNRTAISASLLLSIGCVKSPGTVADFVHTGVSAEASSPAAICRDPSIGDDGLCFPGMQMEEWLQQGDLQFVDSDEPPAGISGLMKLLTGVRHPDLDTPLHVWVKWKPAPKSLSGLNNSPRRERAAYEFQKFFLPQERWVVPTTVMRCVDPIAGHPVEDRALADDVDCVWGQIAYWVNAMEAPGEVDWQRYEDDIAYRRSIADMNLLMYLIGHGDAHKDNWLLSSDEDRPRAMSPDNGVAFSGLGNPLVKNVWGKLNLDAYPADTVARLREIDREQLDTLRVVDTFEVQGRDLVRVEPDLHHIGAQGDYYGDGRVSHGLRGGEVRRLQGRIDKFLQMVDKGELQTYPAGDDAVLTVND